MPGKPLHIYCAGSYAPSNYGNQMLTTNFVTYFERLAGVPCSFSLCVVNDEEQRDMLRQSIPPHIPLTYYHYCAVHSGRSSLLRYPQGAVTFLQEALAPLRCHADAIAVLGGDCIGEVYGAINGAFWLALLSWMTRYSKVFLLSQTIGPFHAWRIPWATRVLNRCRIYTRDQWTHDYLKNELRVTDVQRSCDLAFLELPDQEDCEDILVRYGLAHREYFTVVISSLYAHFADSYDQYLRRWADILQMLLNMKSLSDKKMVLLVHAHRLHLTNPCECTEPQVIAEVCETLGPEWMKRTVPVKDMILPSETRAILGSGEFTITGRMHASVSTFQRKVPAIVLSYSPKFRGVVGDELERNDLIIDNPDREFWKSGRIVGAVEEKVTYVLENRARICAELESRLPAIQDKARFQIKDMLRTLRNDQDDRE